MHYLTLIKITAIVGKMNGGRFMETNSPKHRDALYSMLEEAFGKVVYTYTTQIIHAVHLKNVTLF